MADYEFRRVQTERYEWAVPADYRYGACWAEVMKAVRAAHTKLWELELVPQGKDASDDTIKIYPTDEEIVVCFTVERNGDSVRIV